MDMALHGRSCTLSSQYRSPLPYCNLVILEETGREEKKNHCIIQQLFLPEPCMYWAAAKQVSTTQEQDSMLD